jgi:hypothetical protein
MLYLVLAVVVAHRFTTPKRVLSPGMLGRCGDAVLRPRRLQLADRIGARRATGA